MLYFTLGETYYHDSVLPFYRALKVYPKPLDLIMMYQKTVPDAIFQMIISIMSLEVSNELWSDLCHPQDWLTFVSSADTP